MSLLHFISLFVLLASSCCFGNELQLQEPVGQENTNNAVLDDFKYLLDIVDCPDATPLNQRLTTYRTLIYSRFRQRILAPTCCSWRMERYDKKYTLSKDNTITLTTDGQLRGVIQHFKVSCPNGGLIKQKSITIDLLPPVEFRGEKLCPDSVSFVFNNDNSHICRFCGNKFTLDSDSCTMARFKELLVTFRSGYRPTSPDYSGFKATVLCYDAGQEQDECLMYDPNLTSEKYLDNLKIRDSSQTQDIQLLEAELKFLSKKTPVDAKEFLLQFYSNDRKSSIPNERIFKILNLAILSEQSCDDELATLSKNIQSLFPEETLIQAEIYILDL